MNITDKLVRFIEADLKGNEKKIDPGASLFKNGILSSLDLVALLDFIEKEFGYAVPSADVDFENFDSVTAIANYLQPKLN